jgi:hypothetical protein
MSKTQFTKVMLDSPPMKELKVFDWKAQLGSVSGNWTRTKS